MRKRNAKRVFIWILLILLIVGQTSVVFAGKPQKPTEPPVVVNGIHITTGDLAFDLMENGMVSFTVEATLASQLSVVWSPGTTDDSQLKLTSSSVTKVGKRPATYTARANYTFTPANINSNHLYTYTISAASGDANYDDIEVTFDVKGVYVYVALGDSIPNGVSYDPSYSTTRIESYTDKFYNYLKQKYVNMVPTVYTDYSVSGYNTIDVLNQLNDLSKQQVFRTADVITLCIGSNDIMDAADRDWLGIVDFYDVDIDKANAGRAAFQANYPSIIQTINALNPDVELLVTTLYNPYNNTDSKTNTHVDTVEPITPVDHTTPMYEIVKQYFWNESSEAMGLNYIITNYPLNSVTLKYKVVDVYTRFETEYGDNKGAVTGFYNNWVQDPHPDANGQIEIFNLHTISYELQ